MPLNLQNCMHCCLCETDRVRDVKIYIVILGAVHVLEVSVSDCSTTSTCGCVFFLYTLGGVPLTGDASEFSVIHALYSIFLLFYCGFLCLVATFGSMLG